MLLDDNQLQAHVLPTFIYRLRRPSTLLSRFDQQAINRAVVFVSNAQEISSSPDGYVVEKLVQSKDIDQGEVVLFEAAHSNVDSIIATGDKRSLVALHKSAECRDVYESLCGRVWCLEHILHDIILISNFEAVRARIVPNVECDKVVKAVFGSKMFADRELVLGGLRSYRESLRKDTGGLLALIP